MVNNAAVLVKKPVEEYSEEEWDYMMNINLKGLFFCCQLVGREMIKRKGGKIINISSMVSQQERPIQSVYAATKAGVSRLTQSFAAEWAKYNINVNAIAPGVTLTDINRKYFEEHPKEFKNRISSIPKGREAYPSDYVGAAIFFASDASDYVTGQILFVDGGSIL
jgi:NAD(P)-dependent dehydrogenase (short-subunit alcohol dehydrogenase family)